MRRYIIHIVLFILTVASTLIVGGPAYSFTIILILLGHEMGHVIISHYFVVPPSYRIQEVLTGYVEFQLRKSNR